MMKRQVVGCFSLFLASTDTFAQNAVQRDLEYRSMMMPIQRIMQQAYYANLCQLRSQTFVQVFQEALIEISGIEATKRNLSDDQIIAADRDAKAIIAREDTEAGLENFEAKCRDVANHLDKLDALERSFTGNYH
jgi:hypothetical protein